MEHAPATLIAVGFGTIALAGAAVAPPWVGSLGRQAAPVETRVVPFELAGLYVTDCDVERSIRPQPASCSGLYRVGRPDGIAGLRPVPPGDVLRLPRR